MALPDVMYFGAISTDYMHIRLSTSEIVVQPQPTEMRPPVTGDAVVNVRPHRVSAQSVVSYMIG